VNSFLLLLGSLFVGSHVLEFFGITLPAVRVAGGLVVTAFGWKLLHADEQLADQRAGAQATRKIGSSETFYPLTMPLTVGPGSMSVAITLGSQRPMAADIAHIGNYLVLAGAAVAGLLAIALTVYVCYRFGERMARALGRYTRRYRFEHPGPEELLGTLAEVLGARVATTARLALFAKGWVDYSVESVTDSSAVVRRTGTLSLPVDIELTLADGTTRRERWDGEGESTRIEWPGPPALRAVVVDPDDRVRIDASRENNHMAVVEARTSAPLTFERALYWAQLALQLGAP